MTVVLDVKRLKVDTEGGSAGSLEQTAKRTLLKAGITAELTAFLDFVLSYFTAQCFYSCISSSAVYIGVFHHTWWPFRLLWRQEKWSVVPQSVTLLWTLSNTECVLQAVNNGQRDCVKLYLYWINRPRIQTALLQSFESQRNSVRDENVQKAHPVIKTDYMIKRHWKEIQSFFSSDVFISYRLTS